MKNIFKSIRNAVKNCNNAIQNRVSDSVLADNSGEAYVGEGVKILIAVVIGALLLSLCYALFNKQIMPSVSNTLTKLFGIGNTTAGTGTTIDVSGYTAAGGAA